MNTNLLKNLTDPETDVYFQFFYLNLLDFFSADFEQPRSMMPIEIFHDNSKPGLEAPSCPDVPRGGPRKPKRKKNRASSPTSSARSSSSRSRASFATAYDAFSESQRGFRVA